jgi:hypothetical protein
MARKPPDTSWQEQGFTQNQAELLDRLDFYGNNGWSRNGQPRPLCRFCWVTLNMSV